MGVSGVQPVSALGAALRLRSPQVWRDATRPLDTHDPAVVRQVSAQLVSELVFKPLLAEMRRFPCGAEFAHGGQTEAIFGQQLDERIADMVAATERGGLVDQLAERLMEGIGASGNSGAQAEPTAAQAGQSPEICSDG